MRNKENRGDYVSLHNRGHGSRKTLKGAWSPRKTDSHTKAVKRRMWSGMERTGEGTGECDTIGWTDAAVI